jgi:hypothetical protein
MNDTDQLDDATEQLFDALNDLSIVRGRREALGELLLEEEEDVSDVTRHPDAPQLYMALRHIDAARESVVAEIDACTPEGSPYRRDA